MTHACIFWFTGLSGSGKTTLAADVRDQLTRTGRNILILDGDDVRNRLHRHLGFTPPEIRENNMLIAGLCAEFRHAHDAILVPIISPYRATRQAVRELLAPNFFEIHIHAQIDLLYQRDTKGLYAAAQRGDIDNLIGVSPRNVYEPPILPDLFIDTGLVDRPAAKKMLLDFCVKNLFQTPTCEGLAPKRG